MASNELLFILRLFENATLLWYALQIWYTSTEEGSFFVMVKISNFGSTKNSNFGSTKISKNKKWKSIFPILQATKKLLYSLQILFLPIHSIKVYKKNSITSCGRLTQDPAVASYFSFYFSMVLSQWKSEIWNAFW